MVMVSGGSSVNCLDGLLIGAATVLIVAYSARVVGKWIRKRKRLLILAAKLPGPKALPLIGNALLFAGGSEQLLDRTVEAIVRYENARTPLRFWLGPLLYVVVTEPRHIQVILNSQKATLKGSTYRLLKPFIGEGLISGSDQTWRAHRKLFAPMLNIRTIEGYVEIMEKHSQILVRVLKPLANGVEFDVGPYLSRCTNDGVCEAIMGCGDVNAQDNPDQEFIHAAERMYEITYNRMMKIWLHADWIFRLSSGYKEHENGQRVIRNFTEKLIGDMKKAIAASLEEGTLAGGFDDDRKSILEQLVQRMLQGQPILTEEELRDEIYTVYIASQDTIAVVSSFALLMLGIHKDVQEKVRAEVADVPKTGNALAESLSELKYLDMVIKETLRLFPIAPLLVRRLRGELELDTCVLPEGCEILIANYVTQRSSRHWRDPEMFLPERFSSEEVAGRHPYSYVPFSGGLMSCIGQKFAIMSLKTIIATVVRSYDIQSTTRLEDIKLRSDISIRSVNGYNLSLKSLES